MKKPLNTDSEFRALIPPLSPEESELLEKSILENGIRDPLDVWGNIIIDGHNRYAIACKHNIAFSTRELGFRDRAEAMVWIIDTQRARRNLSKEQLLELGFRRAELLKPKALKNKQTAMAKARGEQLSQESDTTIEPADTLRVAADFAGVSRDTASKYKQVMASGKEEVKQKVREGKLKINPAYQEVKAKPEPEPDPEIKKRNQERMERHRREQARDQEIRSRIIKTPTTGARLNNESVDEYIARWRQARKEEKEAAAEINRLDRAEWKARAISDLRKEWPNHRVGPKGVRFTCPDCGKTRWEDFPRGEEPELCGSCKGRREAVKAFPDHRVSEKGKVEFACKQCGKAYWVDHYATFGARYRKRGYCSDYCEWVSGLKGKPSWNRQEWEKIAAVKKAARDGDRWDGWRPFAGLFEDTAEHKAKDFNLGDPQHDANQEALFEALVEYFDDFEDPNRRLNAIHNVVRKLKPLANACQVEINQVSWAEAENEKNPKQTAPASGPKELILS